MESKRVAVQCLLEALVQRESVSPLSTISLANKNLMSLPSRLGKT